VDDFDLFKQLQANFVSGSWWEGLITGEKVSFEGLSQLLLDEVRPDLIFKGFHHLFVTEIWEVFHITELPVENEHFTFAVGLNKLYADSSSPLAYLSGSSKFRISHGVIFWEFENYWFLAAIYKGLSIKARIDLAKSSFIDLLVNDEAVT
jgi:hypothetical protein